MVESQPTRNTSAQRREELEDLFGKEKRVAYFHHPEVPNFHYGVNHPMKPHRLALTDSLIYAYGLYDHMNVQQPAPATTADLLLFHSPEYIEFLDKISAGNSESATMVRDKFNFAADCPAFPGVGSFCRLYTGGTVCCSRAVIGGEADVAINWSGGLHHAKKFEASGFCYVNDIVVGIQELLVYFPRVMYIDIDVHHGDGVQEAFYNTDRVMTVSIHKHGDGFFPGTGSVDEIGYDRGKYFSLNVPLRSGIDDAGYAYVFEPIIAAAIESFQPSVIVLQGGADSLGGDRLGCFNLSIRGHGDCVKFVKSFGIPVIMLGGGGYTIRNVSRCWTYETSILAGVPLANELPANEYWSFFGPDYRLHPPIHLDSDYANLTTAAAAAAAHSGLNSSHYSSGYLYGTGDSLDNLNTRQYLDAVKATVLERLRRLQGAPSVQMQTIPRLEDFKEEARSEESLKGLVGNSVNSGKKAQLIEALKDNNDEE